MRLADRADRLATGLQAVFSIVDRHPVIGRFIVRAGWPANTSLTMLLDKIVATVNEGIKTSRFAKVLGPVASALVGGVTIGLIHQMSEGSPRDGLSMEAVRVILTGLGIETSEARLVAGRITPATLRKGPLLEKLIS